MNASVVISGYYGFGNAGDEAVLDGILATLAEIGLDERVTVLSGNPVRTMTSHPAARSIHRYSLFSVLNAIRSADLVISGGGSLLQDVTSSRSLHYYLLVMKSAHAMRRKTMVYAQGIGPLNAKGSKRAVGDVLRNVSAITVRDADSLALLESLGVAGATLAADPSFLARADFDAADAVLADHDLTGKRLLGISVRPWGETQWRTVLADCLRDLCESLNLQPVLIPMQPGEDTDLCKQLDLGPVIGSDLAPKAIKGVIARCSLLVGMRLHSLMFATDAGVPFVALAYDPKVWSFARESGCCEALDVNTDFAADLRTSALRVWENRDAISASLSARALELRQSALASGQIAMNLLTGKLAEP